MVFRVPLPTLYSQMQQQQQFQPYQGSQFSLGPQPNPMAQGDTSEDPMQNPLMQKMQERGAQNIMNGLAHPQGQQMGNPLAGQQPQGNPMAGQPVQPNVQPAHTQINWNPTVNGLNAVQPQTQGAADSPFAGNTPTAGALNGPNIIWNKPGHKQHNGQGNNPLNPQQAAKVTVPNGPMPAGNQPAPFTPQAMTDYAPPQGIFPQWAKDAFGFGGYSV